jgi:ATP-dependent DNA ligase
LKSLEARGEALLAEAVELDIEGIVAKRADAPYLPGGRATG